MLVNKIMFNQITIGRNAINSKYGNSPSQNSSKIKFGVRNAYETQDLFIQAIRLLAKKYDRAKRAVNSTLKTLETTTHIQVKPETVLPLEAIGLKANFHKDKLVFIPIKNQHYDKISEYVLKINGIDTYRYVPATESIEKIIKRPDGRGKEVTTHISSTKVENEKEITPYLNALLNKKQETKK